jgi:hypothetical protein
MNKLKFFFSLIFPLFFYSCRKEYTYNCTLINETGYNINLISFDCSIEDVDLSVPAYGTSEPFQLKYKSRFWNFTEPLLCISIKEYEDSLQSYENSVGGMMSISDLEKNNQFVIRTKMPNQLDPSDIFEVTRR